MIPKEFKNKNLEESNDKNIWNSPFKMEIQMSPFYTFKIRISERICLKGDEKLFEL